MNEIIKAIKNWNRKQEQLFQKQQQQSQRQRLYNSGFMVQQAIFDTLESVNIAPQLAGINHISDIKFSGLEYLSDIPYYSFRIPKTSTNRINHVILNSIKEKINNVLLNKTYQICSYYSTLFVEPYKTEYANQYIVFLYYKENFRISYIKDNGLDILIYIKI